MVELKGLTKRIGRHTLVDDLTLLIGKGEVFGLLGPNGAGKTTTIRMITGLIKPTKGEVTIAGYSVTGEFEKAIENIGAVVENPEMYGYLSGYENLLHYARMHKTITKGRIREVVGLVGLEERIHEKVRTYSLGMRQRLGLAQSLLHKPGVLILDEPTNGLDPAGIRELREYLKRLAREEGIAVIVSSHLLAEMEKMCDRIAIIDKGRLIGVEQVDSFVGAKKQKWLILLNEVKTAEKVLAEKGILYSAEERSVTIEAKKEQIPSVIASLVEKECSIYEVSPIKKASLEEEFLLVTGGAK
ncbi:ABC transporter ATP-binding protein [Alteribacter keqinensis]|uniref:ABC transporter ATP-binding protein n=1 Tax=Alteribacter keqinensis TaxID=2483800 RepID=A0A3M7TXD4_9BACI|nr:ABC transporter ATP-binding protein [Alteribacter keqinensis]RNA69434.1 ABC transporter ATP-binding protein [Alteribacter keqinensis]